jgi:Carboxypeptidase regulatory-like domain
MEKDTGISQMNSNLKEKEKQMFFKTNLSGRRGFIEKILFLSVVVLMLWTTAAFAVTIDFSGANGYGMDANTVMIENIRVDTEIGNPFDPTHPELITSYYNVPFEFDYSNLHLVPNLNSSVSVDPTTSCAGLEVYVSDAYTGSPISGASVTVGSSTAISDYAGLATFSNLVSGPAQINCSASDYESASRQVTLNCSSTISVGLALNSIDGPGSISATDIRVILTWGQDPRDLDSHMTGPDAYSDGSTTDEINRFHCYFGSRTHDVAGLDVDDVTSYGPETITVTPPAGSGTLREGLYRYSVHHYSGITDISNSSASVSLQVGGNSYTYTPPAGSPGDDAVWTVFEIVVNSSGYATIYPVNTYTADQSASSVRSTTTGYGSVETGIDFSRLPQK